jgi:hypothetical protein
VTTPDSHSALGQSQAALAAEIMGGEPAAPDQPLLRPLRGMAPVLSVYQTAWLARLTEALRNNFPVLHQVLGDDDFGELTLAYLQSHPPCRPSIRWFGDQLPTFLAAEPERLPHPALADLAQMEWALGLSFDSADTQPLNFEALSRLPPGDWAGLRFAAHPSVSLLALEWAVEPLWQTLTHRPDEDTEPPEASPHHVLAWRLGLETRWRSVPREETALLSAALAGAPFADLCELAAAQGDAEGAPLRMAATLRAWVDAGLLCPA